MNRAFIATVLILGLAMGGCGTFQVSVDRGVTATSVISAVTASGAPAEATLAPTEPAATATQAATPEPGSATRIEFAAGATQSVSRGALQAGESRTFVLAASKGQILLASVDSPAQDAHLTISGGGGTLMGPGVDTFSGTLPATQDYYFQVTSANATAFTLNITIAARILFAPGAKESVLTGRTVDGLSVIYSAYAAKGQKMHVTLDVPDEEAGLTIWGLADGEPYARAQNGVRDFSLLLPSTQDYMIQVMPRAGQVVDYTLTVVID